MFYPISKANWFMVCYTIPEIIDIIKFLEYV